MPRTQQFYRNGTVPPSTGSANEIQNLTIHVQAEYHCFYKCSGFFSNTHKIIITVTKWRKNTSRYLLCIFISKSQEKINFQTVSYQLQNFCDSTPETSILNLPNCCLYQLLKRRNHDLLGNKAILHIKQHVSQNSFG